MNVGACGDWTTAAEVKQLPGLSTASDEVVTDAIDMATDVLYRLSGHRWPGVCERTVRPVGRPARSTPSWWPFQDSSLVLNGWGAYAMLQDARGGCRCNERGLTGLESMQAVTLGAYPVLDVSTVMVDGTALAAAEYQVVDDRWLQRLPNQGETAPRGWPCCQRLDLPDTEPGTWSVTFTYGGLPPISGQLAARAMAAEWVKLWDTTLDGAECRLDPRVTQVTREGLSINLEDVAEAGRDTGFGLPEVRAFLEAVNPNDVRRRARVVNPDRVRTTVRTQATGGSGS